VAATCEGFYFNSPVAYMPGERLVCRLESPVEGKANLVVCVEYEVEVLRIDAGSSDFGVACRIHDLRCLQGPDLVKPS
jgi:hypothetical protein